MIEAIINFYCELHVIKDYPIAIYATPLIKQARLDQTKQGSSYPFPCSGIEIHLKWIIKHKIMIQKIKNNDLSILVISTTITLLKGQVDIELP
jgi:hypothetical protein